jgi:hypothetical protein
VVTFGSRVPAFNSVKGKLALQGKEFILSGMTGKFGTSPFSLEGRIDGYPLKAPASYPFIMKIVPGPAETSWLMDRAGIKDATFRGSSELALSGSGSLADYRLNGSWDLSRADYRFRQLLHKPAGSANRVGFAVLFGTSEVRLTDLQYELPPLEIKANAIYRYSGDEALSFAAATNRFMIGPLLPMLPGLHKYHPSGGVRAEVNGTVDPAGREGLSWKGSASLEDFSLRPADTVKPLTGLNGTINGTDAGMETGRLSGRLGGSPFTVSGKVTGFAVPDAELAFSFPVLNLKDLGYGTTGDDPVVQKISGSVSLKKGRLAISSLAGETGRTMFAMKGDVTDFSNPKVALQIDFPSLVVEDLVPFTRLKRTAQAAGVERSVSLQVRIAAGEGSLKGIPFRRLATAFTLKNGLMIVEKAGAEVFGGSVSCSGQARFDASGVPTVAARYRLAGIDTPKFLRAAGLEKYAAGQLTVDGDIALQGRNWREARTTSRGAADIELTDGRFFVPVGAAHESAREVPFRKILTRISYADKDLTVHSARIEAFDGLIVGDGAAGFGAPNGTSYRARFTAEAIDGGKFLKSIGATSDVTGRLAMQADLAARGEDSAAVLKTLNGTFGMQFEKGVINKFSVASRVFSILNVSQLLDFRLPDMVSTGMPYDHIGGNFAFVAGIASTSDMTIASPSLNMTFVGNVDFVRKEYDMKVGVQTLQTFSNSVNRIPVGGWIMSGKDRTLLVTYYDVKGDWADPKVSAIPVTALPQGMFNIFKRVFTLPGEMITNTDEVIR